MSRKQKQMPFKSEVGVAMYPHLNKPDTQFDTDGVFKVDLRMKKEDAKPLIEAVKEAANDAFGEKAKSAAMPFKTDEETGDIIVKTKSKYQPKICDSTGMRLYPENLPLIYGGSTLKLGGNMYPYSAGGRIGVSLQLGAVQIVSLAEGGTGAGIDFEAVEGGFVAANDNEPATEGDYNF